MSAPVERLELDGVGVGVGSSQLLAAVQVSLKQQGVLPVQAEVSLEVQLVGVGVGVVHEVETVQNELEQQGKPVEHPLSVRVFSKVQAVGSMIGGGVTSQVYEVLQT